MIKINLLPIRAARKREYVKQQLILFLVLVVGALVGCYMWYNTMAGKIDERKKAIKHAKQQIEQYKKAIGEVERYKGLEEMLNRKLKIIENLIKGKSGPVRVLDRLSKLMPKQVWLLSWKEKGGKVEIVEAALSNKNVAQFLSQLEEPLAPAKGAGDEKSKKPPKRFFTNVSLLETSAKDDKTFNRTFIEFRITMKVGYAI
jgi:type IV pilus assembly protein PilN